MNLRKATTGRVDITGDAIKKHEYGEARPRSDVRAAYAVMYGIEVDTLFAGCD
jgi:hypothetical protein